ncbi:MAG: transglutaminase-like enzyme, predicted cysteine protease [Deltaproteobacteria bacterium]|nr:transglutaminase-like enzyme, predicted cysteine protease [Deltaproteobacteria bacterium]
MSDQNSDMYLRPTAIMDSDHPAVQAYAREMVGDAADPVERAVRLYLAVRDDIRYDPYAPFYLPEHYQASKVLEGRRSFCIPKAALLCALGRAVGIPARIGFADVRNHLATRQLLDYLGSNLFVYHGYADLFLEGKWVKATPAFNRELCERHLAAWKRAYGEARIEGWIKRLAEGGMETGRDFAREEVYRS